MAGRSAGLSPYASPGTDIAYGARNAQLTFPPCTGIAPGILAWRMAYWQSVWHTGKAYGILA
eukprot:742263-Rhodomonas_salina.3